MLRRRPGLVGLSVAGVVLGGLVAWRLISPASGPGGGPGGPGGPGGNRAIPVLTAQVVRKDIPVYLEGLGTVVAYNAVTVHSRIDGELVNVAFQEGQDVKAGDLLVQIDPRTYQAALEQALATRDKDQAQLEEAKLDLQRYLSLGNRVTQQSVDSQRSTVRQLEASVKSDIAAIDTAKAQLSYTTITSPIDGRAGLRLVDKGNIVHSSDTTGLVSIAQLKPISVTFTLPQQNLRAINQQLQHQSALPVTATEADGKTVIDQGTVSLVDNAIDQTTGTIKLKATLPNEHLSLWPGGFVNVRLQLDTRHDGLVVPATAIQRGPQGSFVYVVGQDQTAEMRAVTVALTENGETLLEKGVEPGETVVIDGSSRLKAGSKVSLRETAAAPAASPAAPGAAAPDAPAPDAEHKRKRKDGQAQ
ncbi:MAG TPA: efflux RND transporter periplasmic adaptor subunit [Candidatus Sulfotelmatobacter sp.]|jgi:multidrug efflux system membrane fusion protein|nr:efflux RND transporter periplasmic adaptor subunit [Candidatus Sulfotelmatobacter sp.]